MMRKEDGELDLSTLIAEMEPVLNPGCFVFASLSESEIPSDAGWLCKFVEREGVTVITEKAEAERLGWRYSFEAAHITLQVHSALEAVGFLAAVTTALARSGISCNVVSGYYHDHLFVPVSRAEEAMAALTRIRVSDVQRR